MKLASIWGNANTLGQYLLGGTAERRTVILQSGEEKFTLPVTPWKYEVQTAQSNKTVEILDFGEALIFGNAKLKKLKFGVFFPASLHDYPFVVGDKKEPEECIELLENWKEAKKPVRIIITDSPVNLMMAIMSLDYKEKDGSRDIYFDLSLTEYKDLNTPPANNQQQVDKTTGLKERPSEEQPLSKQQKQIQKARDILEKSKKAYGTFKKIQAFKDKNAILHLGLKNTKSWLNGGKWTW